MRVATEAELELLRDIERAAGECFRAIGMPEIADDEPFPVATLREYQMKGRAIVAERDGRPVAYALTDLVDGLVHVEQVSVHPDHGRRGIGRDLLDHINAQTLTTFRDVPWNAPYYARLGFVEIPAGELGPELRAIREHEAAIGLDRWPRLAMRRS